MSGPEQTSPNQDPMQSHAISMGEVRKMRDAIAGPDQPGVPDEMQSRAISMDALRRVRDGLADHGEPATPSAQQVSASVEAAAVRPELPKRGDIAREVDRRMGIAEADRKNRQAAGLPPRTYDLR